MANHRRVLDNGDAFRDFVFRELKAQRAELKAQRAELKAQRESQKRMATLLGSVARDVDSFSKSMTRFVHAVADRFNRVDDALVEILRRLPPRS